jgi:tRNA/rRNA methyltransferase
MALAHVRIVLVEPQGPWNVGSVARVMKNFGLGDLTVVNPHCDILGDDAQKMSCHAFDVLQRARQVDSLVAAVGDCYRVVATTHKRTTTAPDIEHPNVLLPWLLRAASADRPVALVFGAENRGLTNVELSHAHRFLCIPSCPAYPVLNLAQSVAICCNDLFRIAARPPDPHAPRDGAGA